MWNKIFIVFITASILGIMVYFGSSIINPPKIFNQKSGVSDYLNDYIIPSAENLAEKTKSVIEDGLGLTLSESPNLPSFETAKNEVAGDVEAKIYSAAENIAKNIDSLEKSAKKKIVENAVEQMIEKLDPEDKKIAKEVICQSL